MKKIFAFWVLAIFVSGGFSLIAQENTARKELVMKKQDLINALQDISREVWELEAQRANPMVEEPALHFRLNRLESMLSTLMLGMGIQMPQSGENIIIDRTTPGSGNTVYPMIQTPSSPTYFNRSRIVEASPRGISDLQKQLNLLQAQMMLMANELPEDSTRLQMNELSRQMDSLRISNEMLQLQNLMNEQTAEVKTDTVVVTKVVQKTPTLLAQFKRQVFFAVSSSEITSEGKQTLDELALLVKNNPSLNVIITGNSSKDGNVRYNEALSKRRAESVLKYLQNSGVPPEKLQIQNAGEDHSADLLHYGRRVDITVTEK